MKTVLYRLYDSADALLYVGISTNYVERLRTHSHRANPWRDEIAWCSLEFFAHNYQALAAEREAIRDEAPRYNRRSVPGLRPQAVLSGA